MFAANPFDDLVEKATSENLPVGNEDLFVNLDLADKIKSKQIGARYAVLTIKRRLLHKNPNVQLLAIKLLDTCAKNCGSHFLVEVASRDFMDSLVSVSGSLQMSSLEVRKAALALIQTWGLSFKGRPELSYACEVYDTLKREDAVRVCDGCMLKLVAKAAGATTGPAVATATPAKSSGVDAALQKEQEDLERAIAESLGKPSSTNKKPAQNSKPQQPVNEEEDEDLKAAIEASLRDLRIEEERKNKNHQNSSYGVSYPSTDALGGSSFAGFGGNAEYRKAEEENVSAPPVTANPHELTRVEIDNLKLFTDLVERMDADVQQRGIGVMSHSQISTLYTQLFALQPKLQWSVDDASSKYRDSLEVNEKVANALQMYDRMLQERLNSRGFAPYAAAAPQMPFQAPPQAYWNPSPMGYFGLPQNNPQAQQQQYPGQTPPQPIPSLQQQPVTSVGPQTLSQPWTSPEGFIPAQNAVPLNPPMQQANIPNQPPLQQYAGHYEPAAVYQQPQAPYDQYLQQQHPIPPPHQVQQQQMEQYQPKYEAQPVAAHATLPDVKSGPSPAPASFHKQQQPFGSEAASQLQGLEFTAPEMHAQEQSHYPANPAMQAPPLQALPEGSQFVLSSSAGVPAASPSPQQIAQQRQQAPGLSAGYQQLEMLAALPAAPTQDPNAGARHEHHAHPQLQEATLIEF
ncbi:Vacuolar protein-sorting-associated protein 27 [Entophlyctis luteolus]|nr:Vacuolar protein-sorting-associated protein 27 [Entophlyctis luteolus]